MLESWLLVVLVAIPRAVHVWHRRSLGNIVRNTISLAAALFGANAQYLRHVIGHALVSLRRSHTCTHTPDLMLILRSPMCGSLAMM